ncbi:hypothetical protein POF50_031470 [Streptomyces sp. SL13]|uniref:Polynucleotide kinase PNKP phosphatase domain-containing protein n=1 Tax=Streptantibioticus silvisoli TaxID=2705255 RepID=A0AA90HAF6_9ACTN|nr:hypothetical protein [Streptantibioticus silvisoli]MDI5966546.1 hypothetical protein [Streptantibioticus silvisoli]MDI5973808.1 hypothetical protein [Streptantibioticus silvisoli]
MDAQWAVFDLDGTLADTRHRLRFVAGAARDWDAFFAAAPDDLPLAEGVALVRRFTGDGHRIAYVTGRPERCRADTVDWLRRYGLPDGDLVMRGARDRRPARETKLELLRRLGGPAQVAVVVDDDSQVCDAYERAGFSVVRATWMTASATLARAQHDDGRT